MAGNSRRRGAVRKPGSKKGATAGSGGKGRRSLQGRGPTPKAVERTGHPAAARKAAAERRAEAAPRRRVPPAPAGADREVVAGRNAVLELLTTGAPVAELHFAVDPASDHRLTQALELAAARDIPLREGSRAELDQLSGGAVHQGVLARVPPYEYAQPADLLTRATERGEVPLIVLLDGITDPHNLGAVLRSAAAFGAHGVVVGQRRAAGMSAAVWKVSAGAAARVPVARATNLVRALQEYQRAGCFVVGLAGDGEVPVGQVQVATEPLVVVIGAEDKGLSRLVRETCDVVAHIPISAVESLNAAVAAGIALYQVAEHRRPA